jgi:hypothetical protein
VFATLVRLCLPVLLAVAAALLLAAPAPAAPSQRLVFEAPNELRNPALREEALAELESLGVDALRVILYWNDVAPARDARRRPGADLRDPASYDWSVYDPILAAARARGWEVLVTVSGPAPTWATRARRDKLTRPRPDLFERFLTAAGRRYGDQVDLWSIWNEPNLIKFLKPQYAPGRSKRILSGGIYRGLVQGALRGLRRAGQGRDEVLIGETAPRAGRDSPPPLSFLRATLCLDERYRKRRGCGRLDVDGWSHHPYTTRLGPYFRPPSPNEVTMGVLGRLTGALDRAGRAGALPRRLPLHLTEFGIQSSPDRIAGVSLAKQPEFRAIAERMAFHTPRVRTFAQYLLRDDAPDRDATTVAGRYRGFESGLRFANGRAKPSLAGFRLPLSALRDGRGAVSLWGRVRPARAAVTAEVLVRDAGRRGYRLLRRVRTDRRGVLTLRTAYRAGRRWRLRWEGFQGAPTRAYLRRELR